MLAEILKTVVDTAVSTIYWVLAIVLGLVVLSFVIGMMI